METREQPLTEAGIRIPIEELEELGWHEGDRFRIQSAGSAIVISRALSGEEEVRAQALSHLLHHVGDATAVGRPVWTGDNWRVDVFLSYRDQKIGTLVFDREKALVEKESSTREEMLEAALAA